MTSNEAAIRESIQAHQAELDRGVSPDVLNDIYGYVPDSKGSDRTFPLSKRYLGGSVLELCGCEDTYTETSKALAEEELPRQGNANKGDAEYVVEKDRLSGPDLVRSENAGLFAINEAERMTLPPGLDYNQFISLGYSKARRQNSQRG